MLIIKEFESLKGSILDISECFLKDHDGLGL